MRLRNRFIAAAVAGLILATVSTDAEAFCCHRYRSIPVWFGVYYPNCGPCGGCIMPYVASGMYCGYGYCGIGCGCGYGCGSGCGYAYGCGGGCLKRCHRRAAHRAWKRYLRGCGRCFGCVDSCYDSCGGCYASCASGCSDGCSSGCSSCYSGGGAVLSDGPAPADDAPPMPSDQSAGMRRPMMMLVGLRTTQGDGSSHFAKGLDAFRQGSLNAASGQFEAAAAVEPDNALYHYYLALTLHDLYGPEAAAEARQQAVQAELRDPIEGWGKRMERVQGRARVWVEKARREAGLVR